ncbi:hypothetical protein C8R46DRAFT_1221954 [Mycena filopes]|nr:hypothetical protein C8R46DRAFT_1221954 [Mycena filopes]
MSAQSEAHSALPQAACSQLPRPTFQAPGSTVLRCILTLDRLLGGKTHRTPSRFATIASSLLTAADLDASACNIVPALWFAKVAADTAFVRLGATTLAAHLSVEPNLAALWGILSPVPFPTIRKEPNITVVIFCIPTQNTESSYRALHKSFASRPTAIAGAIAKLATVWPPENTLRVRIGDKTWSPTQKASCIQSCRALFLIFSARLVQAPAPLDVTEWIQPGLNIVHFEQSWGLKDYTYVMCAYPRESLPPTPAIPQLLPFIGRTFHDPRASARGTHPWYPAGVLRHSGPPAPAPAHAHAHAHRLVGRDPHSMHRPALVSQHSPSRATHNHSFPPSGSGGGSEMISLRNLGIARGLEIPSGDLSDGSTHKAISHRLHGRAHDHRQKSELKICSSVPVGTSRPHVLPRTSLDPRTKRTATAIHRVVVTTYHPCYTAHLPPPNCEVRVPPPPLQSPPPPPPALGKHFSPAERQFFPEFVTWRLQHDPTLTRKDLCELLASKANSKT